MRKDSSFEHNDTYILAACIAAHANGIKEGFRQKDVKFLIEMLSNWMDMTIGAATIDVHNTQVMRYLNYLVDQDWAKVVARGKQPRYKLTAIGLLTLVSKLVNRPPRYPLENFYFVFHFLETYRPPIEQLLQSESRGLPNAIRIELDFLLDMKKLIDVQLRFLEREVQKLRQRITDSVEVTKIVRKARAEKKITKDVVNEIEKKYPYDLNSQKSLSEFYLEIPDALRDFILDYGIAKRTKQIWIPVLSVMESHVVALKKLKDSLTAKKVSGGVED